MTIPKGPEHCWCEICGKPSIEADTWFNWYPCEDHKHLTPVEYSRLKTENSFQVGE